MRDILNNLHELKDNKLKLLDDEMEKHLNYFMGQFESKGLKIITTTGSQSRAFLEQAEKDKQKCATYDHEAIQNAKLEHALHSGNTAPAAQQSSRDLQYKTNSEVGKQVNESQAHDGEEPSLDWKDFRSEIEKKTVKVIKQELEARNVECKGCKLKREYVKLLAQDMVKVELESRAKQRTKPVAEDAATTSNETEDMDTSPDNSEEHQQLEKEQDDMETEPPALPEKPAPNLVQASLNAEQAKLSTDHALVIPEGDEPENCAEDAHMNAEPSPSQFSPRELASYGGSPVDSKRRKISTEQTPEKSAKPASLSSGPIAMSPDVAGDADGVSANVTRDEVKPYLSENLAQRFEESLPSQSDGGNLEPSPDRYSVASATQRTSQSERFLAVELQEKETSTESKATGTNSDMSTKASQDQNAVRWPTSPPPPPLLDYSMLSKGEGEEDRSKSGQVALQEEEEGTKENRLSTPVSTIANRMPSELDPTPQKKELRVTTQGLPTTLKFGPKSAEKRNSSPARVVHDHKDQQQQNSETSGAPEEQLNLQQEMEERMNRMRSRPASTTQTEILQEAEHMRRQARERMRRKLDEEKSSASQPLPTTATMSPSRLASNDASLPPPPSVDQSYTPKPAAAVLPAKSRAPETFPVSSTPVHVYNHTKAASDVEQTKDIHRVVPKQDSSKKLVHHRSDTAIKAPKYESPRSKFQSHSQPVNHSTPKSTTKFAEIIQKGSNMFRKKGSIIRKKPNPEEERKVAPQHPPAPSNSSAPSGTIPVKSLAQGIRAKQVQPVFRNPDGALKPSKALSTHIPNTNADQATARVRPNGGLLKPKPSSTTQVENSSSSGNLVSSMHRPQGSMKVMTHTPTEPAVRAPPIAGWRPENNYEISDREDSESSSSDEENRAQKKPVPEWAKKSNLHKMLLKQCFGENRPDPDDIFGEIPACDLEVIFKQKKTRYKQRGSSGYWAKDGLTVKDKRQYRKDIGLE